MRSSKIHPIKIHSQNSYAKISLKHLPRHKILILITAIGAMSLIILILSQINTGYPNHKSMKNSQGFDSPLIQLKDNRLDLNEFNELETSNQNNHTNDNGSLNKNTAGDQSLKALNALNGLKSLQSSQVIESSASFKNVGDSNISDTYLNKPLMPLPNHYTENNFNDDLIKSPLIDVKNKITKTVSAPSHQFNSNNQSHKNTQNRIDQASNPSEEMDEDRIQKASFKITEQASASEENTNKYTLPSGFEMNRLQQAPVVKNYQSLEVKKNNHLDHELKAGSFIFAMLNHQITSDIKGEISAIVTQDVFDSTKGVHLLIPKGTQINGSYENQVAFGQNRLAVNWHRLIFSDGSIFNLGNMPGSDGAGNQGVRDLADHHYLKTFAGAILSSILTAGVNAQPNRSSWVDNGKNNLGNQVLEKTSSAAQNLIDKSLETQSTLVIRPGYRFTIKVNQDLNLK
jgi:type IV secretory pathway VirB10-like protein